MGELTKSYLEPLLGPEFLSKMKEINGLLNYLVNYFGGPASFKSLFLGSGLDLVFCFVFRSKGGRDHRPDAATSGRSSGDYRPDAAASRRLGGD